MRPEGPIGLRKHWHHSVFTACMTDLIIRRMPKALRPSEGVAYLCGLLHNFGYLILGEIFPQHFEKN